MTDDLAIRVEECCLNAWPPLRQVLLDFWQLRFSGGRSRRANSVNPIGPGRRDAAEKIELCERLYRGHGQPTIFRLQPVADADLDAELARRGYTVEDENGVFYADLTRSAAPELGGRDVVASEAPSEDWLAAVIRLNRLTDEEAAIYRRIVATIAVPTVFVASRVEGRIAAIAYAALHDGIACLNSVATDPQHRRQGLGRRTVGAALAWARHQGATGACLQMLATNAPARALYQSFGFETELYRYHYRRQGRQS